MWVLVLVAALYVWIEYRLWKEQIELNRLLVARALEESSDGE